MNNTVIFQNVIILISARVELLFLNLDEYRLPNAMLSRHVWPSNSFYRESFARTRMHFVSLSVNCCISKDFIVTKLVRLVTLSALFKTLSRLHVLYFFVLNFS